MSVRPSLLRAWPAAALLLALACGDDGSPPPPVDGGADAADGGTDAGVDTGPAPSCVADPATDFPAPVGGRCEAAPPTAAALRPVGPDGEGGFIIPSGRRVTLVGRHVPLPGFPLAVELIPGTPFAVVTDGAVGAEQLSVVDTSSGTIVDTRPFRQNQNEALFLGMAARSDGSRLFVSGGGSNFVRIYDVDTATGELTDVAPIDTGFEYRSGYITGLALLSDERTLALTLLHENIVLLYDTEARAEVARIPLIDGARPFDIVVLPDDSMAYVTAWARGSVIPVDLVARRAGTPIEVGKNPEGLELSPDGATLVVANSDSDSVSFIDVGTGMVTRTFWIENETTPRGSAPAAVTFGPDGRLYVVTSGENAIDVLDLEGAAPTRVGRIPTHWYPTDVHVAADGTVLVTNGKYEGTGANTDPGRDDITELVGGSLQIVAPDDRTDADLSRWAVEVASNNDRATRFQEVACPDGAEYDFPIPRPGTGPSPVIEHVIVLVRENKTYDAYLGNLQKDGAPHGNGDPTLTLLPPDEMETIVPNTHELARQFAIGDNYYSLAEQSVQGHFWTTHGRTTDFVERSWLTTWGRAFWGVPPQGVATPIGYAEEGSVFDWLVENEIEVANYGEAVSARAVRLEARYPGLVYGYGVEDRERATWLAEQWRDRCRLRTFSYIVMPNDHTEGYRPGRPTPRSHIADNDYGVGLVAEGLSHSTYWPRSLLVVIEDDPQDGGDHVDNHRAPVHLISPWVRRGHVSSVHYNEASIYRTIQLILGVDEPLNAYWANASPMWDMFTSTPDYTPYEAIERRYPVELAGGGVRNEFTEMSAAWDWTLPDNQPGLSRMLWRHLRGTEPPWPLEVPLEDGDEDD